MYVNVMRLLVNKLCGQPMAKDLFEYDSEEKVNNILVRLHRTSSWSHQEYLFICGT